MNEIFVKQCEAELCRRSLAEFARRAWHAIEPDVELDWGWHLEALCIHLQAVSEGRIPGNRLLINIGPGYGKSIFVAVMWPAWMWTWKPGFRSLFASYDGALSQRDSLRCRDVLRSPWFNETFWPEWDFAGDQNVKGYFKNTASGVRQSVTVDGQGTGFRGDAVVVDDPIKAQKAHKAENHEKVRTWWGGTMSSRLNDQRTGIKVVVMQRLHPEDLAGTLIKQGGYEHLCLPSEFNPKRRCRTSIGWEDPRTEAGEPLFPERFGPEVLAIARADMGSGEYQGQHNQDPVRGKGTLFQRNWFLCVDAGPTIGRVVRYWDLAATENGGKRTAGVKLLEVGGVWFILDVVKGQWSPDGVIGAIRATAEADGKKVPVVFEHEGGSSGKFAAQQITRHLRGWQVHGHRPSGDKVTRAKPFAAQCEAGNVKVVRGNWYVDFLDEFECFPGGSFKDQVDATSGGFQWLCEQEGRRVEVTVR